MTARLPLPLALYRVGTGLLAPAAPLLLRRRAGRGKEDPARMSERLGHPGCPRPAGALVWVHGASVGEATSLLGLVDRLTARGLEVVATTGTRNAAAVLAERLPAGARHQYLPLDLRPAIGRFLAHWRPHLAIFAESEIWPNTVVALAERGIPLCIVNGRMSPGSFAGWRRAPVVARALFGRVSLCLAQSDEDGRRFAALGAPDVAVPGNLKFDGPALPSDERAVQALAGQIAGRPVWMAASTHPGEEEAVLAAHRVIARESPTLLTILAPRHPVRAGHVAEMAAREGLAATRRSAGEPPGAVHLVDTIGELGLFYRLAPLAFVGGSLVRHGGQNPIEPARLGSAVLHGPHVGNFTDIYRALDAAGGALEVEGPERLAAAASDLLADGALARDMARAGARCVAGFTGALDRTMAALEPFLPPPGSP